MMLWLLFLATTAAAPDSAPTGLLTNYLSSPSLGVTAAPVLSWIVPACGGADATATHMVAYRVVVAEEQLVSGGVAYALIWDSGKVVSNASVNVAYGGPALLAARVYVWCATISFKPVQYQPIQATAAVP